MRVLACADSDSYLKWALSLLAQAPADWQPAYAVLENVIAPSPAQIAAVASGAAVPRLSLTALVRRVARERPEVVLLAMTGPALEVTMSALARGGVLGAGRPVLAGGLPGISYPANALAVRHRRDMDLMVLHSHREVAAYGEVVDRHREANPDGRGPQVALATLPFLIDPPRASGHEVVFAAQSLVPPEPAQRRSILAALARLPVEFTPVVKIRALPGERQAHNEAHPYARLWESMDQPRPIEFRAGSMAETLRYAGGFVTVSSTALLEAVAAKVPSLVLADFGVDEAMINVVFEGSGLLGTLADLQAGWFRRPDPGWLWENYFHDPADNDWIERLLALGHTRDAGGLAPIDYHPMGSRRDRLRRRLRVSPPGWVWAITRRNGGG